VVLLLLPGLAPGDLDAQLPGYKSRNPEELRAQYIQGLMEGVNEVWDRYETRWSEDEDLADLFSGDALLVVPGEEGRRRRDAIEEYFTQLLPVTSGLELATAHIDGSDDLAVIFGPYRVTGVTSTAGTLRDDGDHITVLRQEGRFWRVRLQVFMSAPSGQPRLWWQGEPAERLPLFHLGLPIGSSEFRTRVRRGAIGGFDTTLQHFRAAWSEGDERALRDLVTDDVFLRAPNGEVSLGADGAVAAFRSIPMGFGSLLQTAPLDFESSGRIAVKSSRYVLEAEDIPEGYRTGILYTVMRLVGREWKVRALFFSPWG
jgi:ketosteroid isomerase-like protein